MTISHFTDGLLRSGVCSRTISRPASSLVVAVALCIAGCQKDNTNGAIDAVADASAQSSAPNTNGAQSASPGEPLSASAKGSTDLTGAAAATDKQSAVAVYRSATACVSGQRAKAFLARKALEPGSWVNSPEKMTELSSEQLELAQKQTRLAQDFDKNCAEAEGLTESGDLYEMAKLAANSGNREAAFCYAAGTLPRPKTWEQDAARFNDYRENSLRYIREGMQAGDWRAVALSLEASGGRTLGWISSLTGPDPEMAYELTRLQRLGADGSAATDLDDQLQIRARGLSPQVIAAADRRAEATFQRSFAKSPPFRNNVVACPT